MDGCSESRWKPQRGRAKMISPEAAPGKLNLLHDEKSLPNYTRQRSQSLLRAQTCGAGVGGAEPATLC